jgi:hypothetical protein
MTYIQVDPTLLSSVGDQLTNSVKVLEEIKSSSAPLKALVDNCGHPTFHGTACEFIERWTHGVSCLGQDAQTLGRLLTSSGNVYIDTETRIADAATQMASNLGGGGS